MDRKDKLMLGIIAVIGWIVIGYIVWFFLQKPKKNAPLTTKQEYDRFTLEPKSYKKISTQAFTCVVLTCDIGPVKVYIDSEVIPSIEFHRTFMKYADMTYSGDTLFIHTSKTPKSTRETPIEREIFIHSNQLKYYRTEVSQTFFSKFKTEQLKVDNRSSYIRFISCAIDKLDLTTNKSCNYLMDRGCYFNHIRAEINPNSKFTCFSHIEKDITLKSKDLTNVTMPSNSFKKLKVEAWK